MPRERFRLPRACRVVAWTGAGFFGCQLALALFIERGHPELTDPEFGTRLQLLRARLAEQPGHPLALILGSSRTAMGIKPEFLPARPSDGNSSAVAFNFSLVGGGSLTQLLVLNRLLDRGIEPDWVICEAGLDLLTYAEESALQNRRSLSLSDLPVLARHFPDPWPVYLSCLHGQFLSSYMYRYHLQARVLGFPLAVHDLQEAVYWQSLDDLGWLPCPWNIRGRIDFSRIMQEQVEAGARMRWFHVNACAEQALLDLLDVCERRQIAVTLIAMPESSEYQGCYSADSRVAYRRYLANLRRAHPISIIDARTWLTDDDFADAVHLTPQGACRFTDRFGREFRRSVACQGLL